jgi:AcrR family transcriptional regulator
MQIRKSSAIRQKEIVLAARKLIVKYGSEYVTVRRIAQEIGVTEGAIYKHFKSKRDVLSLLVDDIEDTWIADIDSNHNSEIDTLEELEKIVEAHISAIQQRKGVTFQAVAEILSLGDKKLNKKVTQGIERYLEKIKAILADGVQTGVIRRDVDLDVASQMFFSLTQGYVTTWALSHYSFDLSARYKPAWRLFIRSIAQAPEKIK